MFPEQLKKILKLIRKTHDRVVIFDASTPEESFVVMDFDNYSDLAAPLGKPEPPANLPSDPAGSGDNVPTEKRNSQLKGNLTEEDLTDKINREISMWKNGEGSPFLAEENKARSGWKIPPGVKDKAQEIKE